MPRRNFTPAIIKARLEFAGHRCEATLADGSRCQVKAERGRFQCDHDNPDGLTGEPTFENARILCLAHHAEKTARDVARIAKAKRVEAKHIGARQAGASPLAGRDRGQINAARDERRKRVAPDKSPLPPRRPMFVTASAGDRS